MEKMGFSKGVVQFVKRRKGRLAMINKKGNVKRRQIGENRSRQEKRTRFGKKKKDEVERGRKK